MDLNISIRYAKNQNRLFREMIETIESQMRANDKLVEYLLAKIQERDE